MVRIDIFPMAYRYERILRFACDSGLEFLVSRILGSKNCEEPWWVEITDEYRCAYEAVLGELVNSL